MASSEFQTPIETILTDVGGVLLMPNPEFWVRLREELRPDPEVDPEAVFYGAEGPWSACRTGEIDYVSFMRAVAARLQVDAGRLEAIRSVYEVTVNQAMVEFLGGARAMGLRIVAVSNADTMLEQRLYARGLWPVFDAVVNSARVGAAKPDPRIYHHALKAAGSKPAACLLIDDKERNLPEAEEMGIQVALFTPDEAFAERLPASVARLYPASAPIEARGWPVDKAGA